jgi:hypothetical protein
MHPADQWCAVLFFDPDERAAASPRRSRASIRGEAAGCGPCDCSRKFALNARDWNALREGFAPDVVVADHRRLGFGAVDRDTWLALLDSTRELTVGLAFEIYRVLAWNERGVLFGLRRRGSVAGGGGPLENESLALALSAGDRIARYELFDEPDSERALARFEALCAG